MYTLESKFIYVLSVGKDDKKVYLSAPGFWSDYENAKKFDSPDDAARQVMAEQKSVFQRITIERACKVSTESQVKR